MLTCLGTNHARPFGSESGEGLPVELVQTPFQISLVTSVARSPEEHQGIEAEVQAGLAKGAIMRAHPQMEQFTSKLFLIPKKEGSLCPAVNLRPSGQTTTSRWREFA